MTFEFPEHEELDPLLAHHSLSELRGMRLLLTGCTGFFGRWLLLGLARLNAQGHGIEVVLTSRDPDRSASQLPLLSHARWARVERCNLISDPLPGGRFDAIVHGAADTSAAAVKHPLELFETIVEGSRKVLRRAHEDRCHRILLLGSGAVYRTQPADCALLSEHDPCGGDPRDANNAYAEGKRTMEAMAAAWAGEHALRVVVARCFAFVGAGLPLDAHFAIGNFIRDALANDPIRVNGSGRAIRSYLYAADLTVWLLVMLARARPGSTYNVGSDQGLSIYDLAQLVHKTLAPNTSVTTLGDRGVEARPRYVPSINAARRDLGLEVWTPLEQAITQTARDLGRSQRNTITALQE